MFSRFHQHLWGFTETRIFKLFVIPHLAFLFLAWVTDASELIFIFNAGLIALATGVCASYFPLVVDVFSKRGPMSRSDWFACGVFFGWYGGLLTRLISLVWRWMGQPAWFITSDITTYSQFVLICAAAFYLIAPGDKPEALVPPMKWIYKGVWVAAGVFLLIILTRFIEAYTATTILPI